MPPTLRLFSFFVIASAAALGCDAEATPSDLARSAENRADVIEGAHVATAEEVRDVDVQPDALVLPRQGHEDLAATWKNGAIVVGDRNPAASSKNPLGFLRRVKQVRSEGDRIVVETSPAAIDELFRRAHLLLSLNEPAPVGPSTANVRPRTETPSADQGGKGYGFEQQSLTLSSEVSVKGSRPVNMKLQLSDVSAHVNPNIQLKVDKDAGQTSGDVAATIKAKFDSGMKFCGEADYAKDATIADQTKAAGKAIFDGRLYTITIPVAGVPVVATVHGTIEATCSVSISGKAAMKGDYDVRGNPELAIGMGTPETSATPSSPPDGVNVQANGTLAVDTVGETHLRCGLSVKLGVYLYDVLGVYGSVKPSMDFAVTGGGGVNTDQKTNAAACSSVTAGISSDIGVEARAFGRSFFDKHTTPWELGPLDVMSTCLMKDSCAGRADGWYCSDMDPTSAIQCAGQTIAIGHQCAGAEGYCQRTADGHAEADVDGAPRCTSEAPKTKVVKAADIACAL